MKKGFIWPLLLFVLLTSCGNGLEAAPYQIEDAKALIDQGAFSGALTEVDREVVPLIYGLEDTAIKESVCYTAANSSVSADEVAVFVMEDAAGAEAAAAACRQRMEDQVDIYQTYGPDQVPRLEAATILQRDNTVLLAVGEPEKLPEALKELGLGE